MSSIYSLFWTDEAIDNMNGIVNYLEQNWTQKEKSDFFKKLEKRTGIIKQYPEIFPKSQKSDKVHRSVLTEQITIYYSVENQIIKILSLFDVRQDPVKLKI
jgi:plasmid stabilization system protein ParE